MGYLDNIIIFSKTEEDHLRHIEIIFQKLRKADLKLQLQKCNIQYLGHLIYANISTFPVDLKIYKKNFS